MNLLHAEETTALMTGLGYPEYLMTILGVAKLLGVLAVLLPGRPLLREWAYAGFTFDMLGAGASHILAEDPVSSMMAAVISLVLLSASYYLGPTSRRLVA